MGDCGRGRIATAVSGCPFAGARRRVSASELPLSRFFLRGLAFAFALALSALVSPRAAFPQTEDLLPSFSPATFAEQLYLLNENVGTVYLPAPSSLGNGPSSLALEPELPDGLQYGQADEIEGSLVNGGSISGTPTESKERTSYTLTLTDTDGDKATLTFFLTVERDDSPEFSPNTYDAQVYVRGERISDLALPKATGGNGTLSYGLSPALPLGLAFDDSTRAISGTPSELKAETVYTLTATDADGDEATLTFSLTVEEDLEPGFSPNTYAAQNYRQNSPVPDLALPKATGGNGTLSYGLSPALPRGLAFDDSTRVISGTPSEVKAETVYTLTATDADGDEATLTFALEVREDLVPAFNPNMYEAQNYTRSVRISPVALPKATGGDGTLSYGFRPDLPAGLAFDGSSLEISGTPTELKSRTPYMLAATDEDGDVATLMFFLSVGEMEVRMMSVQVVNSGGFRIVAPVEPRTTESGDEAMFSVTLAARPDHEVTVALRSSNSREARVSPPEIVFTPDDWNRARTVTVTGLDDDEVDGDQAYRVLLDARSDDERYDSSDPEDIEFLNVDDDASVLSITTSGSVEEGDEGAATEAEFTVELSRPNPREVAVGYMTADGTARRGVDYREAMGMLVFAPGETAKTFSVRINGDGEAEADETFFARLASPSNARIGTAEAGVVISNDDGAVVTPRSPRLLFVGATTVRVVVSVASELDLRVFLPPRLTENGRVMEDVTVTFSPSRESEVDERFGFTGTPADHTLADIDVSPVHDGGLKLCLIGMRRLREAAGDRRLVLLRHSGEWRALPSEPEDERVCSGNVDSFSSFAVGYVAESAPGRFGDVNRTILPELARAMTSSTLAAVKGRLEAAMTRTAAGTGRPADSRKNLRFGGADPLREPDGSPLPLAQALENSSFEVSLAGGMPGVANPHSPTPDPGKIAVWMEGDYRRLSGGDGSAVDWEGGLFGGHLGVDARVGSAFLAGAAVSVFRGSFDYADGAGADGSEGKHRSVMNSFHPYVGFSPSQRFSLWATAGWGFGEIEIDDDRFGRRSGDGRLRTAAAGTNVRLFSSGPTTLDLKGEAWLTRLKVEDGGSMKGMEVDVNRLRMALKGSRALSLASGAALSPSLEIGLHRDGGDGETGVGSELGGGLSYLSPGGTLSAEARGRVLLFHQGDVRRWGAGGAVRFGPGTSGRGFSMSVLPSYGEARSGVERLWRSGAAGWDEDGPAPSLRLETEMGYGLSAFGDRGLLTPYGAFGSSRGEGGSYRAGGRLSLGSAFDVSLEGERLESETGGSEHGLALRGRMKW